MPENSVDQVVESAVRWPREDVVELAGSSPGLSITRLLDLPAGLYALEARLDANTMSLTLRIAPDGAARLLWCVDGALAELAEGEGGWRGGFAPTARRVRARATDSPLLAALTAFIAETPPELGGAGGWARCFVALASAEDLGWQEVDGLCPFLERAVGLRDIFCADSSPPAKASDGSYPGDDPGYAPFPGGPWQKLERAAVPAGQTPTDFSISRCWQMVITRFWPDPWDVKIEQLPDKLWKATSTRKLKLEYRWDWIAVVRVAWECPTGGGEKVSCYVMQKGTAKELKTVETITQVSPSEAWARKVLPTDQKVPWAHLTTECAVDPAPEQPKTPPKPQPPG